MKKTITPPEQHTALFALRNNLSLSDQRIFLYLLKSAFRHNKGLTSAKKDILELYATFELGQRLNKETGNFCSPCKTFAEKKDEHLLYWNSKPEELSQSQVDYKGKIFNYLQYKNGYISYQLNSDIVPLLQAVLSKFEKFSYSVSSLAEAKSKYTLRLQEMLLLGRGSGHRNIYTVGQLRAVLLADNPNTYKQNKTEFLRHCIAPAMKEISEISGKNFSYTLLEDKKLQFSKQSLNFLKLQENDLTDDDF